jgi:hypothetical protein
MHDRLVQGQQGRLLATVLGLRRREADVDLVRQPAGLPGRAERVDECLQLAGSSTEPGRCPQEHDIRPGQILRRRFERIGRIITVLLPLLIAFDGLGRSDLGDVAQPHLGAGLLGGLRDPFGHLLDGPGR